jgi:ABC-type polysaccharide/polyol phosphate transport system ATPase subunit
MAEPTTEARTTEPRTADARPTDARPPDAGPIGARTTETRTTEARARDAGDAHTTDARTSETVDGGREFPAAADTSGSPDGELPENAPTAAAQPDARAGDAAIHVRDLGIRYNLRLTRKTTLKSSLPSFMGRDDGTPKHFWALRNVSFRLEHGESLGVIGPNGAGKSTLLLALAGILDPSEGEIMTNGRVSTLLTLGAGFEQELSGRDNIDLVAAFLGVDAREMAALAPSIIEFADIGPFIDAPVKTYSTGMKARLGFAIATAITPDILLLDEVIGTGDQTFRARSQARVQELIEKAKAIVLVTHDLTFVSEFCNRALLIERGQVIREGPPGEIVDLYKNRVAERKLLAEAEAHRFGGSGRS